ncbi:unnamed protein product [Ceutorhynchus assimilis]|uniref:LIM zinc-binding domain-containing protein n=1 Tax=Ceutorhynchus assimilis TaxID=467358 RepID=A0A9N9N0A5_9CUCU|nr:unnamed protein product [Ceutorhynchus assimilis]
MNVFEKKTHKVWVKTMLPQCGINEKNISAALPWSGLTWACIRILQLYAKVFDQDINKFNPKKTCKNCRCSKDGHEVQAEHGARSRLGLAGHEDGLNARSLGYTFVPPGLTTAKQVDQYYSTLPSEEVPKLGSKGETIRSQRIVKQLPKQDLSLSACKFVEQEYATSYEDFVSGRNQVALDVGVAKSAPPNSVCKSCDRPWSAQQIVVSAPRLGQMVWHPGCFKCSECDDLLVDLAYCVYNDKLFCERHYAEKMKPRCAGCDEVRIFFCNS